MSAGDRFTAADVARFCAVDLKTIHNWAKKGKLPHARTLGGHLRFRRAELVAFLRAYEYALPPPLRTGRPSVIACDPEASALVTVRRALGRRFDLRVFTDAIDALVAVGASEPDVLVVGATLAGVDAAHLVTRLGDARETAHLRVVVFAADETRGEALLAGGASAFVRRAQPAKLREALESITGLSA
jgi:excisionase family DNA binding protein